MLSPTVVKAQTTVVSVPIVSTVATSPTIESQVHNLSLKYQINEKMVWRIINCESGGNPKAIHHNLNGTYDFSYLQINSSHIPEMTQMGLATSSWADDVTYGFVLINRNGFRDWSASKECWLNT